MRCNASPHGHTQVLPYQGAMVDNQRLARLSCDTGPVTVGVAEAFFVLWQRCTGRGSHSTFGAEVKNLQEFDEWLKTVS